VAQNKLLYFYILRHSAIPYLLPAPCEISIRTHLCRLGNDTARFYFDQLLQAVKHCHSRGVCHRDIQVFDDLCAYLRGVHSKGVSMHDEIEPCIQVSLSGVSLPQVDQIAGSPLFSLQSTMYSPKDCLRLSPLHPPHDPGTNDPTAFPTAFPTAPFLLTRTNRT